MDLKPLYRHTEVKRVMVDKTQVLKVGDKVIATMRSCGLGHRGQRYSGTVEAVTECFTVIYTGRCRVTVLAADLHCGQAVAEISERKAGQSGE